MAIFSVILLTAAPAGHGTEAGGAFVRVDGREALLRSTELFLNRDPIKHHQIVFLQDALEDSKSRFGGHLSFSGVKVVAGGPRWIDQLAAASERLAAEVTHVLIHDAARPAVPYSDIDAILEAAEKHPAVALASPVRNELVETDEAGNPLAYHSALQFMNLLTPQIYRRDKLMEIVKSRSALHASQLTLLKGSPLNVRVGGPGDAALAKTMIAMLPKPKIRAASPFEEAQW